MTEISQYKSLVVVDVLLSTRFVLGPSHFPIHSRLVALKEGEIVGLNRERWVFQFELGGALQGVLSFRQVAKVLMA